MHNIKCQRVRGQRISMGLRSEKANLAVGGTNPSSRKLSNGFHQPVSEDLFVRVASDSLYVQQRRDDATI
jgi:hypothetical protein